MAEAFVFNVEALVTRDYLDARLGEQDARIEQRFTEQDARIEQRLVEMNARFDKRFAEIESGLLGLETRFEKRFAALDVRLERELGAVHKQLHLHSWMLAIIAVSTVVPAVRSLLGY